jgi:adenylate cyclase
MAGEQMARGLDEVLLSGRRRYTSREVAELAGVPVYRARRFWRALGFPNVDDEAVEFTAADVKALVTLLRLVSDGVTDEQTALQMTRSLGQAAARLAESQAELAVGGLDAAGLDGTQRWRAGHLLARRLLPDLEHLLVYAWRRQLAAAANRLDHIDHATGAAWLAVGFADLVGFTRLARRVEVAELAELVERFEGGSADLIAHSGGRMVKTLGDSVLFVADTPQVAAETALRLVEAHAADRTLPEIRVGLAVGPVVSRMGDVFGSTVNLANRLTALAHPDSVLVDEETAVSLAGDGRYVLRGIRRRAVRGFGQLEPFSLARAGSESDGGEPSAQA